MMVWGCFKSIPIGSVGRRRRNDEFGEVHFDVKERFPAFFFADSRIEIDYTCKITRLATNRIDQWLGSNEIESMYCHGQQDRLILIRSKIFGIR